MKHTIYALTMFALAACTSPQEEAIDRHALVTRNNPEVTAMDSLSSLSVGNGEFAYTVDASFALSGSLGWVAYSSLCPWPKSYSTKASSGL